MEEKYGEAFPPMVVARDSPQGHGSIRWDIQVILPTGNNGNFAYRVALKDLELGAAMCRAYNNWAHDYCSVDPKRLKFVAILPGSDIGEMVKEARRAVQELGAVSVRNPLLPDGKWLHDPENDRLGACLRIGLSHQRAWRSIESTAPSHSESSREIDATRSSSLCGGSIMLWVFPLTLATLGSHFISRVSWQSVLPTLPVLECYESNALGCLFGCGA